VHSSVKSSLLDSEVYYSPYGLIAEIVTSCANVPEVRLTTIECLRIPKYKCDVAFMINHLAILAFFLKSQVLIQCV
jgi:hypothetical protein